MDVQVEQGNTPSATVCSDRFQYGTAPAVGAPEILSISPDSAAGLTPVTVTGVNLSTSDFVTFGGVSATVLKANSTAVTVLVPLANGTVPVAVSNQFDQSLPVCADIFHASFPSASPGIKTSNLPKSIFAEPFELNGSNAIVAINSTNGSIMIYNQSGATWTFLTHSLVPVNNLTASSIFGSIGGTSLDVAVQSAGQLAVASNPNGSDVMLAYTTDSKGRVALMTLSSTDSGKLWNGPYLSTTGTGSASDPQLAWGQDGDFYASWVNGIGGGAFNIAQSVFSPSSSVLMSPAILPGSYANSSAGNASLSLALDGFQRPFEVWSNISSYEEPTTSYTGAFETPTVALSALWAGLNNTVVPDFGPFGVQGIQSFKQGLNSSFQLQEAALSPLSFCAALQVAVQSIYRYVTPMDLPPVLQGPLPNSCTISPGTDNSELSKQQLGASSATFYLTIQVEIFLMALGYGTMPTQSWILNPSPAQPAKPFQMGKGASFSDWAGDQINVTPETLNPISVWLNTTYHFRTTVLSNYNWHENKWNNWTWCGYVNTLYTPVYFWSNVTAWNTSDGWSKTQNNFSSTGLPQPYLTNLSAAINGSWSIVFSILFNESKQSVNLCPASYGFTNSTKQVVGGNPTKVTTTLSGTFTTGFSFDPVAPEGIDQKGSVMFPWNNTVFARSDGWLNQTLNGAPIKVWANRTLGTSEEGIFSSIPSGQTNYTAHFVTTTAWGNTNGSWNPMTNLNLMTNSTPEQGTYTCSFTQPLNPLPMWWYGSGPPAPPTDFASNITNVTSTGVTITWYSTVQALGWVSGWGDLGDSINQEAQVVQFFNLSHQTVFRYTVELHGLQPWGTYWIQVHLRSTAGCVQFRNSGTTWLLQLPATFTFVEQDQPYDSITKAGGGAILYWQVPTNFTQRSSLINASLVVSTTSPSLGTRVYNLSEPSVAASTPSSFSNIVTNTTYTYTIYNLTPNSQNTIAGFLNYSIRTPGGAVEELTATSTPRSFTYLVDTSGDGLSNAEKLAGWNVTTEGSTGTWSTQIETANPDLFATNGLTNDYIEKEFGLNPNTIETTNSSMLDVWNLTFDLGSGGALPSSGFNYWYENSTYDFADACPQPDQGSCSFSPHTGYSNLTDDSPGSSTYLWTGTGASNALAKLEALISNEHVAPLRAVTGSYAGDRTMTVWGKLSWGANPLAWSTPMISGPGGVPSDGQRVNPLGGVYVALNVTSFWTGNSVASGDRAAVFFDANSAAAPYYSLGQVDYSGYGNNSSKFASHVIARTTSFQVTFPVVSTEQYVSVNMSVVVNKSGTLSSLTSAAINLDMADFTSSPVTETSFSGTKWAINYTFQAIPDSSKATTYIITPGNNSTLSNLPLGLKRYTGEQNFVLLELNDSAPGANSLSVTGINYANFSAQGGISAATYGVYLSQGINNILVPRTLFKDSPLGASLLNTTSTNAIVGNTINRILQPSWTPAYWANRTIGGAYNGNSYGKGSWGAIQVYSNVTATGSSQNCTIVSRCGLDPGNLVVSKKFSSNAVQAIVTLNISSDVDLTDLLAGLLLNYSGNFTAWALPATQFISSLGLPASVTNALANVVLFNQGKFGAPTYTPPPPPPPPAWLQVGAEIWNVVSGTFLTIFSVIWAAIQAAASFMMFLATTAASWGLKAISATIGALRVVAGAIIWAIDQVATYILAEATATLTIVFHPVLACATSYAKSVNSLTWKAQNDSQNSTMIPTGLILQIGTALAGCVAEGALVIAFTAMAVLWLLAPFAIGPSMLLPIILGLIFSSPAATSATSGLLGEVFSDLGSYTEAALTNIFDWLGGSGNQPPAWATATKIITTLASGTVSTFGLVGTLYIMKPSSSAENMQLAGYQFALVIVTFIMWVASLAFHLSIGFKLLIYLLGILTWGIGVYRYLSWTRVDPETGNQDFGLLSVICGGANVAVGTDIILNTAGVT